MSNKIFIITINDSFVDYRKCNIFRDCNLTPLIPGFKNIIHIENQYLTNHICFERYSINSYTPGYSNLYQFEKQVINSILTEDIPENYKIYFTPNSIFKNEIKFLNDNDVVYINGISQTTFINNIKYDYSYENKLPPNISCIVQTFKEIYLAMKEVRNLINLFVTTEFIFHKKNSNSKNLQIIKNLYKDYDTNNFLNLKILLDTKKQIKEKIKIADNFLNTCEYLEFNQQYQTKLKEISNVKSQINQIINQTDACDEHKRTLFCLTIEKEKYKKIIKNLKSQIDSSVNEYNKYIQIKNENEKFLNEIKEKINIYLN